MRRSTACVYASTVKPAPLRTCSLLRGTRATKLSSFTTRGWWIRAQPTSAGCHLLTPLACPPSGETTLTQLSLSCPRASRSCSTKALELVTHQKQNVCRERIPESDSDHIRQPRVRIGFAGNQKLSMVGLDTVPSNDGGGRGRQQGDAAFEAPAGLCGAAALSVPVACSLLGGRPRPPLPNVTDRAAV
jgi:hypothetical protein